jgi:hypothetical protein
MVKTTPDFLDAQKPALAIPFLAYCPWGDIRMSASWIARKQGMNPDLTNHNDAIYNKNGVRIGRILRKNRWKFVCLIYIVVIIEPFIVISGMVLKNTA